MEIIKGLPELFYLIALQFVTIGELLIFGCISGIQKIFRDVCSKSLWN